MSNIVNVSKLFGNVTKFMKEAKQTGKIDLEILESLRVLFSEFKQMSIYWSESKHEEQLEYLFSLYHLSRNCGLVLRKMIQRFEELPGIDGNLTVVDDALQVLPILIDTFAILEEVKSNSINQFRVQGFDRTRHLRNIARMADMLPNEDEDLASIPIEIRERVYKVFVESIIDVATQLSVLGQFRIGLGDEND